MINEYKTFAKSFTKVAAADIRSQVEAIYSKNTFWKDPLIQINPEFQQGKSIADFVSVGELAEQVGKMFCRNGHPIRLHKHQEQAVSLANSGESFVVTTGTGSGKSLCYFVPIASFVFRQRKTDSRQRTKAIIIYPMNALANSQLEEIKRFADNLDEANRFTYALYTGQQTNEQRRAISENPPDILLTNFMMLEYLMTRQDDLDRRVMENCEGLQFLVLDELHTYRGRQGADVAMLVRRVRQRLSPESLQCIGTSATMASEGTEADRRKVVAKVASDLFAANISSENIIGETLRRKTSVLQSVDSIRSSLAATIESLDLRALNDEQLALHPLVIWIELKLGICSDTSGRWIRSKPLTLDEASEQLRNDSGCQLSACAQALRDALFACSLQEHTRLGTDGPSRSFFAFKLHQFISGAGHAYSTFEQIGVRTITVDGQQFLPSAPSKRLYSTHFCRKCGHEYHPVQLLEDSGVRRFVARDIDDVPVMADSEGEPAFEQASGFLKLHPNDHSLDFSGRDEEYPEQWFEETRRGDRRIKPNYRRARAQEFMVAPDGAIGIGERAWFIEGSFRYCLHCGDTHVGSSRDRNRLASLTAEGRSSATTVLTSSVLQWMHRTSVGLPAHSRKLLGFTDNRQDAALQAGHFNDFLQVSLIRAAFLGALTHAASSGLRSEALGVAQQKALRFEVTNLNNRSEWLRDVSLRGFNLNQAEATLREVLAYRVWFDQRRGWRYTNPNLEQLGLLQVQYLGISELSSDDSLFGTTILASLTSSERENLFVEVLDHLRKFMAVRSKLLVEIDQTISRSHSWLRAPWGFGSDEKPRRAGWLFLVAPNRGRTNRDEDLIVRGGSRSALGKALRIEQAQLRQLSSADLDAVIENLLEAARTHGLVSSEPTSFDQMIGYQLNEGCVLFMRDVSGAGAQIENPFFKDFYANLAGVLRNEVHPYFEFEAREHTAQVDQKKRAIREKRFRFGQQEQQELARLDPGEVAESSRFLPVMFCSPTMELGVDIAELNAVYLRNMPPTPANYAQRSGRAGRGGQAALVITYSSSQSPHDQYYFRDPKMMVHGEVRPPMLDLANRELVESHLAATWLASTRVELDPSISRLLSLNEIERPLLESITSQMETPDVLERALSQVNSLLKRIENELTHDRAPWFAVGREKFAQDFLQNVLSNFKRAFNRWRTLFEAAERQRDSARRIMDDHSAPQSEKSAAKGRHDQAYAQLNLLQVSGDNDSNDFFTYRYLATEGFLPGYNFPRLPLMAYIPATTEGRGQRFLQRPRFLALSEFGPRSLIYHEGRAFRVERVMLGISGQTSPNDVRLPTRSVRICSQCGAAHWDDADSLCHACETPLATAEIVNRVFRVENVATRPAERITANDEDRQRQGFELQTTFEWAKRETGFDVRRLSTADESGQILQLTFGASATITRLNKGLRRRQDRTQLGYRIDPSSGFWAKAVDEERDDRDPTENPREWVVPCVEDRKNALLMMPTPGLLDEIAAVTVQHALLRGIEAEFQLEQGEMLAEPVPTREHRRGFLLYEATEGGAGVLSQLVANPKKLLAVATKALSILHFDIEGGLPEDAELLKDLARESCVAACYRCVMSYYNQPEHSTLNRQMPSVKNFLLRLAKAQANTFDSTPPNVTSPEDLDWLRCWHDAAIPYGLPNADERPLALLEHHLPLVWRQHFVIASVGELPIAIISRLREKGFELVLFPGDAHMWAESFAQLEKLLGARR